MAVNNSPSHFYGLTAISEIEEASKRIESIAAAILESGSNPPLSPISLSCFYRYFPGRLAAGGVKEIRRLMGLGARSGGAGCRRT